MEVPKYPTEAEDLDRKKRDKASFLPKSLNSFGYEVLGTARDAFKRRGENVSTQSVFTSILNTFLLAEENSCQKQKKNSIVRCKIKLNQVVGKIVQCTTIIFFLGKEGGENVCSALT